MTTESLPFGPGQAADLAVQARPQIVLATVHDLAGLEMIQRLREHRLQVRAEIRAQSGGGSRRSSRAG